jgi:endonuclease/exonuclease/phosphatase family metal-dependent hydrolase
MTKQINGFLLAVVLLSLLSCSEKIAISSSKKESYKTPNGDLKVLCYNIHHANPPSKPGLIDLDAIAAAITKENPDIVALQEVDRLMKRSGNVDQAKLLSEKTKMNYRFFKAINHDGGEYGTMMLSKYPISDVQMISLPEAFPGEDRVLGCMTVKLPSGKKFIFANTHLDAQKKDGTRTLQMQAILKELGTKKGPVVLCGDLNSVETSEAIKLLDQQFIRTCKGHCPGTIPVINPVKTIDYIAVKNAAWSIKEYKVIAETYASDHRPVVVTFKIDGTR